MERGRESSNYTRLTCNNSGDKGAEKHYNSGATSLLNLTFAPPLLLAELVELIDGNDNTGGCTLRDEITLSL